MSDVENNIKERGRLFSTVQSLKDIPSVVLAGVRLGVGSKEKNNIRKIEKTMYGDIQGINEKQK